MITQEHSQESHSPAEKRQKISESKAIPAPNLVKVRRFAKQLNNKLVYLF
jgi:hypothetical protein